MSSIVNKIKEAVHSDSKSHSAPEGTHGPHNSRVANAADPRVDSDRDHSSTIGTGRTAGHGEYGNTGYVTGATTGTGTGRTAGHGEFGSSGYGTGTAEGAHGPHGSRVANAVDPRVDSDRDNSRTMGTGTGAGLGFGTTGTHHTAGTGTGFGSGTTGTQHAPGGFGSGTTGTHHTAGGVGAGSGITGMTGTHGASEGTHGPHSSRMANAADPRVDSDRDGRGAIGTGPGPASNTAGPHQKRHGQQDGPPRRLRP